MGDKIWVADTSQLGRNTEFIKEPRKEKFARNLGS